MKKDLLITFATEFVVLAAGIVVYKLAAVNLGKSGFSEYALSRRTVSLLLPALLLGFRVGIPRYISLSEAGTGNQSADTYFLAGLSIIASMALLFTVSINIFRKEFSLLFFGSIHYAYLAIPIAFNVVGLLFQTACYAYFRGKLLMKRANALQALSLGMVPLAAFSLADSTEVVLLLTGAGFLIVTMVFFVPVAGKLRVSRSEIFLSAKELLAYGLRRVPGDFGMAALFSLPATITAHMTGVGKAGQVAFGISLLNMVGGLFAPLGLVFLPQVSRLVAKRDFRSLRYYVWRAGGITFFLTLAGFAIFELFAERIIHLYLGQDYGDVVSISRITMVGALAFTQYVSLRSVLDAYYVKAVNTVNIFLSLFAFLALSVVASIVADGHHSILLSFVSALFLLALLTLYEIRKMLQSSTEIGPGVSPVWNSRK